MSFCRHLLHPRHYEKSLRQTLDLPVWSKRWELEKVRYVDMMNETSTHGREISSDGLLSVGLSWAVREPNLLPVWKIVRDILIHVSTYLEIWLCKWMVSIASWSPAVLVNLKPPYFTRERELYDLRMLITRRIQNNQTGFVYASFVFEQNLNDLLLYGNLFSLQGDEIWCYLAIKPWCHTITIVRRHVILFCYVGFNKMIFKTRFVSQHTMLGHFWVRTSGHKSEIVTTVVWHLEWWSESFVLCQIEIY